MDEDSLTLVIDLIVILIGAGVAINAVIQLLIEFRVNEIDGTRSYFNARILRYLLFLLLGGIVVSLRIWYIAQR